MSLPAFLRIKYKFGISISFSDLHIWAHVFMTPLKWSPQRPYWTLDTFSAPTVLSYLAFHQVVGHFPPKTLSRLFQCFSLSPLCSFDCTFFVPFGFSSQLHKYWYSLEFHHCSYSLLAIHHLWCWFHVDTCANDAQVCPCNASFFLGPADYFWRTWTFKRQA